MAETLEKARRYLERHLVPEDKFGWGPSLVRDEFTLLADPVPMTNAHMVISTSGIPLECSAIAYRLQQDILEHDPQLRPRTMIYQKDDFHMWVDVSDPGSGRTVQIDATPWYACLDPGHEGSECVVESILPVAVPLTESMGLPLTVRKSAKGFITTYLYGALPSASIEYVLEALQGKGVMELPDMPHYMFRMIAIESEGFYSPPRKMLCVRFEIPDARRLADAGPATMDRLVGGRLLMMGVDPLDTAAPVVWVPSVDVLRNRLPGNPLLAEAERNFPAMMKLLEKAKIELPQCRGDGQMDVGMKGVVVYCGAEGLGSITRFLDMRHAGSAPRRPGRRARY